MKKFAISLAFLASGVSQMAAQDPALIRAGHNTYLDILSREFMYRRLSDPAVDEEETARRLAAENSERQFIKKANAFTQLWSAFIVEYNEKKAFNVRIVKEATKAFHDLERCDGWRRDTP